MIFTQIGEKPESDFTEPLGMLSDCHKRIRYFLAALVTLAGQATEAPLTVNQHGDLEKALWYFREAGPRHTADEEESLFPRLRAMNIPRVRRAFEKLDKLEADHKQAEADHDDIDALGRRWLSDRVLSKEDTRQMRVLLASLTRLYNRHLVMEEAEIFTLAEGVLSGGEKKLLGQEMAMRRGTLQRSTRAKLN